MTVYELVKQYGLEGYTKRYFNVYGNRCDTKYPLPQLAEMKAKSVTIHFPTQTADITIVAY